jgi:LacI family transcriptional regulator
MNHSETHSLAVGQGLRRNVLLLLAWHSMDVFRGIARFARDAGWVLDSRFERSGEVPETWSGDGVLGVLGVHPEVDRFAVRCKAPFVNIGYSAIGSAPRVMADQAQIAKLAADHFRNRGFRHFCYYLRDHQPGNLGRCEALRAELARTGNELIVIDGQFGEGSNGSARIRWLARRLKSLPKPAALLAEIDDYAIEVVQAAVSAGIHVPEELAVLGVGNDELRCPLAPVPLSSINDNEQGIGQQSAALLEQLMNGRPAPQQPLIVPPLGVVTRQSTDILAIDHPMVARALKAIREQFHQPLTAEGMIASVPMSRRRLHDAFVRALGRSVAEELTRLRVNHAKRLLSETPSKLHEISSACGFNSEARLVIVFTRQTGMTPGEYRKAFNPDAPKTAKVGRPSGSRKRE